MKWALMALWTSIMGNAGFASIHHFSTKDECEAVVRQLHEYEVSKGTQGVFFCQEEVK